MSSNQQDRLLQRQARAPERRASIRAALENIREKQSPVVYRR
jgi:hypothetical protein